MRRLAPLFTTRGAMLVWLPVVLVTALHYGAPHHAAWMHSVARRGFYVPILLAAALAGIPGGLTAALTAIVLYLPHALGYGVHHVDPGGSSEKWLEMGFYLVLGGLAGAVAERAQRDRERQAELVAELSSTLEQVQAKDAQLERASRLEALGQLSAGLAHEIKNPLHAMRGTAEIVLDVVPEDAEERPLAEALITEIDRLSTVLQRFLDYARSADAERSPLDVAEVTAHVADLLRAQAGKQGTAVVLEGASAEVVANRDQLVQVALAIAINGLQALEQGGRLTLRSEPGALVVENDGPLIEEALLERIFDPFVSTRDTGTGLGLSTAWRIVDDHGGRIEVENLDDGVRFAIRLPTD
ncbi:MAG: hypothetical protein EP330_27950 [Deltaproteobacteria bacterium]|nr:MAG: hypothetical protein EP330_27950 [Deltaproteobacteria bacterium]